MSGAVAKSVGRFLFALGCALTAIVCVSGAAESRAGSWNERFQVGEWIWAPATMDKQTCRFWRTVDMPAGKAIVDAHLRLTADNAYRLFLDGKELGRGTEWKSLTDFDLTWVLKPGLHVIAVEAFNDYLEGGFVAGLHVEFADGSILDVPSDATWKLVPLDDNGWLTRRTPRAEWAAARVVAPYVNTIWKNIPARIVRQPVNPVTERFWQQGWFQVASISVSAVVALLCLYLLSRLALQATAQEVLQRERARIARDIHDDFGARLTKLVLVGELAQSELGTPSSLRSRFEQVSTEGRNLLGALDEVVWTVNSRRDTVRDFETHVCNYAETFLRAADVRLRIDSDPELPEAAFDLPIRRNLFLAVKEALNNAVRHAGATQVQLGLHLRGDHLTVTVEDNGRGFDPAAADRERNGLSNMAHRTAEVGGSCRVISKPGSGCRIELAAPLRHRRRPFWQRWRARRI